MPHFLSFTALFAAVAARPSAPYDYDVVTVAPGVFAYVEKKLDGVVSSNVVAVTGDRATLVFDTGIHPRITRRIIADLKTRTNQPVRYVVVSHWHDDHWIGNAEFAEAFPGLQVIAHSFTARLMNERKSHFGGETCRTRLETESQPLRDRLASGKQADGTPLTEAGIGRAREFLDAIDEQAAQCGEMRFRGVDRTVDRGLTLDLGGRTVELMFLGRGNTAGDLVAWLPADKVLLAGDLLVHPFPFATQSYITEWARVLRSIDRMDVATIVPGHGKVQPDHRYLTDMAELLESMGSQGRAAYTEGMTADELRARIDLTGMSERFSHGDAFIKANFDAMMKGSAIDRLWQELSGEWKPEGDR